MDVNHNFGRIPDYLIKMHNDKYLNFVRREYDEILNSIPPGMRCLSYGERIQTLNNLVEARDELINNLERYPIMSINVNRSKVAERDRDLLE